MSVTVVRQREESIALDHDAVDGGLFIIQESFGYLVNYLARSFARALAAQLAPHGVSLAQWAVLLFLWAKDGPTQKELSRQVAIEEPTMVRTIDRMERDGLVRRVRDRHDRRRINIFLTDRGRELRDVLVPRAIAVNDAALQQLSNTEQHQTMALLHRIIASLERHPSFQEGT